MRSHGVSWDDPASLSKLMGNGELVKVVIVGRVQAECN